MCFTYPKMDAKVNLKVDAKVCVSFTLKVDAKVCGIPYPKVDAKVCVSLTLRWMLRYVFHLP